MKPSLWLSMVVVFVVSLGNAGAQTPGPWPMIEAVERQPLLAQLARLRETLRHIGNPLSEDLELAITEAARNPDEAGLVTRVQEMLDPLCLAAVELADGRPPRVVPRPGAVELYEQGWRAYLVKVVNGPEVRSRLRVSSPQAKPLPHSPADEVASRWLDLAMFDGQPMASSLTGLKLEYRILELYARDPGSRDAHIEFAAPRSADARSDATGSVVMNWHFDQDEAGWQGLNQIECAARDGALHLRGTGNDPYFGVRLPRSLDPGEYVLRFWAKADEPGVGQLFWSTTDRPHPDGDHMVLFDVEAGRERLYEIPFEAEGQLVGLRLDPNGRPCHWRIDWLELATARAGREWGGATFRLDTLPSSVVTFRVLDDPDRPAMGCFEIRDRAGRVYPALTKRLAPDFFFQSQIYRGDGETIRLPVGEYDVRCSRGPESLVETLPLSVAEEPVVFEYRVKRWIDPSRRGYWSGDHHIHAAGCAHYENPTQGVMPPDMLRHCMGEDLKVGCCLTWGPCFDFQKRFFTGKPDDHSRYPYLIRYDVEVSGFGSHASGHLNLLRLQSQIPPGGDSNGHWPTLGLNTLRWAKRQGAVCGPAHSAIGLTRFVDRVPGSEGFDGPDGLPNFRIPAFDGIGANEFIMNIAHQVPGPHGRRVPAVDFISTMNTDRTAEWNIWYHVLNCGFRPRIAGETDFPCLSGERVGVGRTYVRLEGPLDFDRWCDALAAGRGYASDGRTHLMEFTVAPAESAVSKAGQRVELEVGTGASELALNGAGEVRFWVHAAALRPEESPQRVELIVNGYPVAEREIPGDGRERLIEFRHRIEKSSWAAIRIFPSAHTNPVFVLVDGRPIRANRQSAAWCLASVEQCWKAKRDTYRVDELAGAQRDYDAARAVFEQIEQESR